jgi:hypothetical protein
VKDKNNFIANGRIYFARSNSTFLNSALAEFNLWVAIALGATHIRVGTAIFGERQK